MKKILSRSMLVIMVALAAAVWTGVPEVHAATGPICYVGSGATVTPDGNAWASAWPLPQTALGDSHCDEIWVKAGVYRPGAADTDAFNVTEGTAIYGGFEGNETLRTQRDPYAHVTILSGDIEEDDVNTDDNHIDESTADIVGTNIHRVVAMINLTAPITDATVLDGFVITGGDGGLGAGLGCAYSDACSPKLSNLLFSGNRAVYGGAMYVVAGPTTTANPSLTSVQFIGNHADYGGAITIWGGSPTFGAVIFRNNSAGYGGAVHIHAGPGETVSPNFKAATFEGNTATSEGGAVYNEGSDGVLSPGFEVVSFVNNGAVNYGGAVSNHETFGQVNPTFLDVTFHGNSAGSGGAISNTVTDAGGSASPHLTNVTFSGNSAGNGGAMHNVAYGGTTVSPTLTNVILWGDSATGFGDEVYNNEVAAVPTFTYSLIQGAMPGGVWDTSIGANGGNNLDVDPLLDPIHNNWVMPLLWGSPAIDAGAPGSCPPTDQRGITRPQGAGCDIGAYERIAPLSLVDFDADDTSDLGVFRPSTNGWYVKDHLATVYGLAGDIPMPGYYNADRLADVAVFRPSTAGWYAQGVGSTIYGLPGDIPVPADYDGKGTMEIAVYRPSTSAWYVKDKSATVYGLTGDIPVPADYNGDGTADIAVYRPSTTAWYVKDVLATVYGMVGDFPLPAPDTNGDGDPYQ